MKNKEIFYSDNVSIDPYPALGRIFYNLNWNIVFDSKINFSYIYYYLKTVFHNDNKTADSAKKMRSS